MRTLLATEMRRLLARRLVRLMVLLAVVGIATGAGIVFIRSHRAEPAETGRLLAEARAARQSEIEACAAGAFGIRQQDVPPGTTLREFCEEQVVPPAQPSDPRFHLVSVRDATGGLNGILMVLLAVAAASFVGAEWHTGSIVTLLTWEPRRGRVLLAKLAAVVLFAFLASALLQALLGLALVPAGVFRGTTEGADATWLRSMVGLVLRGAAVAAMVAAVSCSIASIARNTAAAVGVGFAYVAVLEPIIRGLRPGWEPWLLYDNAATVILGQPAGFTTEARSIGGAALVLSLYVVGLAAIAVAAFRARDVT